MGVVIRRSRLLLTPIVALVLAFASGCSGATSTASSSGTPSGAAAGVAGATQSSYTAVVAAVSPSVVLIETQSGLGSGVAFDAQGDIVTNAHVVGTSQTMIVTAADGTQFDASLVGKYAGGDIAVIKVPAGKIHPAAWGDSSKLQVGEVVLAMGNPLGYQSSVTEGIISGLGRTVAEPNGAVLTDVVQTSAAINPGNSGGALVDMQSRVVGLPTLTAVDPQVGGVAPGIGFALPSSLVSEYANQIIKNGKVVNTNRAYLGVQVGETSGTGVVVLAVALGGPADKAGIRAGDIIVSVNGRTIESTSALSIALAELTPGTNASIGVNRDSTAMSVTVMLGTMPAA